MKLTTQSRAVNYMALARGPATDYDEWARIFGEDGWKWDNLAVISFTYSMGYGVWPSIQNVPISPQLW